MNFPDSQSKFTHEVYFEENRKWIVLLVMLKTVHYELGQLDFD